MLMESTLRRADEARLPVYLEATQEGARAYPKVGFEKCGELPCGDSRIILMTRQPSRQT